MEQDFDFDFSSCKFEADKIWAVGYSVAAFISLAGGGMLGALAFALLAIDSMTGDRSEDSELIKPKNLLRGAPNRPQDEVMILGGDGQLFPASQVNPFEVPETPTFQDFDPFAIPPGQSLIEPEPQDQHRAETSQPVPVTVQVTPDIDIHNHIESIAQRNVKTAVPAQSDRRTLAPDLSLYSDPKQRMQVLLKAMAQSGFPLGSLINHPFVWCWGRSQSGKTTIAILLSMIRMTMGHKISYFTTDDDYPRALNWQRVEDSPEGYAIALDDAAQTISQASKGSLAGHGWVFDEVFAAYTQYEISIQPLLTTVLMKGAKTKSGSIGISQADTSSAHGLKGLDAAWREERASIQAIHEENAQGDRYPTGRYLVARGDTAEEWILPEWMLTELNQWGAPDPVVWMQKNFPELAVNRSGSTAVQDGSKPNLVNSVVQPVQRLNPNEIKPVQDSGSEVQRFVNQQFNLEEARSKVSELVQLGLNQTQIIQVLWGAKKGGSAAYQTAVAEYKILTGETSDV